MLPSASQDLQIHTHCKASHHELMYVHSAWGDAKFGEKVITIQFYIIFLKYLNRISELLTFWVRLSTITTLSTPSSIRYSKNVLNLKYEPGLGRLLGSLFYPMALYAMCMDIKSY